MIYRSKSGGVKRWAKMLTTAVLAFVLAIVVFASTAFAGLLNEYNVDIVVDGVTTNRDPDQCKHYAGEHRQAGPFRL